VTLEDGTVTGGNSVGTGDGDAASRAGQGARAIVELVKWRASSPLSAPAHHRHDSV
jgi:hypothetical protein